MSDTSSTRRTVLRAAAWSAPAVVIATAAPAFAASTPGNPDVPVCVPKGCKFPGRSNKERIKSYRLAPGCLDEMIESVTINGKPAVPDGRGNWWLRDQPNSKSPLPVTIHFVDGQEWIGTVKFLPCKTDC